MEQAVKSQQVSVVSNEFNSRNEITAHEEGSPLLNPRLFGDMEKLALLMSKTSSMPTHLRGNPGDCLRVIELAFRIKQSPFAMADGTYFVAGKLGMDGKTIASLINSHPKIDGSLDYEYSGNVKSPSDYKCKVIGKLKGEDKYREVEISLQQGIDDSKHVDKSGNVKGPNPRWIKDPMQMMAYYGARVWARRHAPEVIAGLYTEDELQTIPVKGVVTRIEKNVTPRKRKEEVVDHVKDTIESGFATEGFNELLGAVNSSPTLDDLQSLVLELQRFKGLPGELKKLRSAYRDKLELLKNNDLEQQENSLTDAMEAKNVDDTVSAQ
jgi:hypothetical protein